MGRLEQLILRAKENDEKAMLEILEMFEPLIKKYHRLLNYEEDLKQEIIYKIIKLVKAEIVFEKLRSLNDYVLLKYIADSVYHRYIQLSKNKNFATNYECSEEIMLDIAGFQNINDDFMIIDLLKSLLTEKEFICLYYTVIQGYTSEETSKMLNITKQACNQTKLRAIGKIRKYYEGIEK